MKKFTSIDLYLAAQAPKQKAALQKLRKTVRKTAPSAEEVISYGMPAFKYRGRMLVGFAAFKDHCSFFPWHSATIMKTFKKELKDFSTSKGTIRFTTEKLLPESLLVRMVKLRMKENEEKEGK